MAVSRNRKVTPPIHPIKWSVPKSALANLNISDEHSCVLWVVLHHLLLDNCNSRTLESRLGENDDVFILGESWDPNPSTWPNKRTVPQKDQEKGSHLNHNIRWNNFLKDEPPIKLSCEKMLCSNFVSATRDTTFEFVHNFQLVQCIAVSMPSMSCHRHLCDSYKLHTFIDNRCVFVFFHYDWFEFLFLCKTRKSL